MIENLKNIIKHCPTIKAAYQYDDETGMNPAYQDIEHSCLLPVNEKRIWVLRSDMVLATGIKQIYADYGNTNLYDKVVDGSQQYINANDRYGHTSLTIPTSNYDGSAYYAGWITQRKDRLEIFLCTGRFHDDKLVAFQRKCIEMHIAEQFMSAYGKQNVVFFDFNENEVNEGQGLTDYLTDKNLEGTHTMRVYTPELIDQVSTLKEITAEGLFNLTKKQTSKLKSNQIAPAPVESKQIQPIAMKLAESKRNSQVAVAPLKSKESPVVGGRANGQRSNSLMTRFMNFFSRPASQASVRTIQVAPRAASYISRK